MNKPPADRARGQVADLVVATRRFVRDSVLPVDDAHDGDVAAAGGDALRITLQDSARAEGVFGPHVPVELGGHGLGMCARAPVFEEAGFSLFGPLALNVAAPDEGNVHLLEVVASGEQRARYLGPLARGDVRSAFAMTEPSPGAGSDPSLLATRAERVAGGWRITGHKTFITGADGAAFLIVMARTSGEPGDRVERPCSSSTPGRPVAPSVGTCRPWTARCSAATARCTWTVSVSDDAVLGAVDEGFAYAQVRLGPARMTHVMRWLGAARRAHEVAVGTPPTVRPSDPGSADLGMVQQLIADNEIDLAATRALLMEACRGARRRWPCIGVDLDREDVRGRGARTGSRTGRSRCAAGSGCRRPAGARMLRELRAFRMYDGPTEVHRWSIARRALRRHEGHARDDDFVHASGRSGRGDLLTGCGVDVRGELTASRSPADGRTSPIVSDGNGRWVVRRPPAGAHPVRSRRGPRVPGGPRPGGDRVPVPPVAVCEDGSLIGSPFTVVEHVDGIAIRTQEDLGQLDDVARARVRERPGRRPCPAAPHRPPAVGLKSLAGREATESGRCDGGPGSGRSRLRRVRDADRLRDRLTALVPEQRRVR